MKYSLSKIHIVGSHVVAFMLLTIFVLLGSLIIRFIFYSNDPCEQYGSIFVFVMFCWIYACVQHIFKIVWNIHKQNCKSVVIDKNRKLFILERKKNKIVLLPFDEVSEISVKIGFISLRGTAYIIPDNRDIGDIKIKTNFGKNYMLMTQNAEDFFNEVPEEICKNITKQLLYSP